MRVLVLGGTGFIGAAVTQALQQQGAAVTVLCRNIGSLDKAAALGAVPLAGDIRTPGDWAAAVRRFDAVVHAACTFDVGMGEVDAGVVQALLQSLRDATGGRRRLLYTAGVWCYGNADGRVLDERSPFDPVPAFAWGVTHSRQVLATRDAEGVVLHPANVVDGGDDGLPRVLLQPDDAGVLHAPGPPGIRWPLVERHDLAQAYVRALDRARAGSEYLLAGELGVPMAQLAAAAARKLGLQGPPQHEPAAYWQARYGEWAAGYCLDQVVDSSRAARELGWQPAFMRC